MSKRFVTVITVLSILTLFPNQMSRAHAFRPLTSSSPAKEKKAPCAPCAAGQNSSGLNSVDSVATLGRRTQSLPFLPVQNSIFDGAMINLVSTATGHLKFAVTDLEISGAMPIMFQRAYNSDNDEDTGLGKGWSFVFDDRISLDGRAAKLSSGTGLVLSFSRDGQSQHFVLKTAEPNEHQAFDVADENTIIEQAAVLTRTYKKLGETYRLSRITDLNGNAITIRFNAQGNVSQIVSSSGGALTLEWSGGQNTRLLAVTDNVNRRVSFNQDGRRLRAVTTPAGAQWTYDYQGGYLTQAADPLNRIMLRARYDKANRVVETGDAAGTSLFEYDSGTPGVSRQTTVTDPLGAKTVFEHTKLGALLSVRDDEEKELLRTEYNAANRPVRVSNSLGGATIFAYDTGNRLIKQSSDDGTFQTLIYDEHGQVASTITNAGRIDYTRDTRGNVLMARSDNPSQSYQTTRDSHGQLTEIKSEAGSEVSLEYDASGNTSAFAVGKTGRFVIEHDAAGQVISRRLPSGATYRYEYDARGRVTKQSDNRGHSVTFERDASGAKTGVMTAGGDWVRAARDQAGRIISLKTSSGKSRYFVYDARGALTTYTDARGKRKHFDYDKRGRLKSVEGDDGSIAVIERDQKGRVQHISSFSSERGQDGFSLGGGFGTSVQQRMARIMPSSYKPDLAAALLSPQDSFCFFGTDGFTDMNLTFEMGFSCSDPFGGFGFDPYSGEGYDSFDPFLGFEAAAGETCEQCKARHQRICELTFRRACSYTSLGTATLVGAGCLALGGGLGLPICIALIFSGIGWAGAACRALYEACVLAIVDKCPQC